MASSCWTTRGWARKCLAEARMATSSVEVRAAVNLALLAAPSRGVTGGWGPGTPWSGWKSYDRASMSSRVEYSFSSLMASSSHTLDLVLLVPALPGYSWLSLENCRQLAISAYTVALEKCCVRICCCMGLTRNCDTCGDRSCSHVRVVSVRAWTMMRMACTME